jgi:uncharacterized membrane protein
LYDNQGRNRDGGRIHRNGRLASPIAGSPSPWRERGVNLRGRRACATLLAGLALAAAAGSARAEFTVCNQTLDVVNLAIGQEVDDAFQTEGWWTVGANQCAEVIREELANRFIYVYANDVFGQPILSGTTAMCVGKNRFVIRGIESCWQRGHMAVKFYEVDTQAVERWTLFLTSPMLP